MTAQNIPHTPRPGGGAVVVVFGGGAAFTLSNVVERAPASSAMSYDAGPVHSGIQTPLISWPHPGGPAHPVLTPPPAPWPV